MSIAAHIIGSIGPISPTYFPINGSAAPMMYAGRVTENLCLKPRQENISNRLMQVTMAMAAGNTYVFDNHRIGKSIITATMAVITLFNIKTKLSFQNSCY